MSGRVVAPVDIHQEFSIGARATTSNASLAMASGVALIDLERRVNTLVYLCVAGHVRCLDFGSGADLLKQARIAAMLQKAAPQASAALRAAPSDLMEVPLRQTIAFLPQWVSAAAALASGFAEAVLQAAGRAVAEATTAVDSRCPRWGEHINDNHMHDQGARIQLVMNPGLSALPGECRALHVAMTPAGQVADTLGVAIDSHADLRETLRAARNSFGFGKKTVNVAAATKVLFSALVRMASVRSMLTLRDTLPIALATRLEALLEETLTAPHPSGATPASSAHASSGIKRSRSSCSVGVEAAPAPMGKA